MDHLSKQRRHPYGIGDLIGVAALVGIIGGAMFFERWEYARHHSSDASYEKAPENSVSTAGASTPQGRWSKSEFDEHIANKTKAQVRDEFGPPASVDDYSDSWTYWDIPVYDAEAGVKVHATIIRFVGMEGRDDFAVGAHYN